MKTFPKTGKAPSAPRAKPAGSKAEPNFMEVVYKIVRRIPKGRATSYGAIAEASGIRLTARMVGWAMNAAGRAKPPVPAHRVVNSKGVLSGRAHFSTPTLMQELLEQEGIAVENDRITDFKTVFWDPAGKKPAAPKPGPAARPKAADAATRKPTGKSAAKAAGTKPAAAANQGKRAHSGKAPAAQKKNSASPRTATRPKKEK